MTLLEPIADVTVTVPDEYIGDLGARRGRVFGSVARSGEAVVTASAPGVTPPPAPSGDPWSLKLAQALIDATTHPEVWRLATPSTATLSRTETCARCSKPPLRWHYVAADRKPTIAHG